MCVLVSSPLHYKIRVRCWLSCHSGDQAYLVLSYSLALASPKLWGVDTLAGDAPVPRVVLSCTLAVLDRLIEFNSENGGCGGRGCIVDEAERGWQPIMGSPDYSAEPTSLEIVLTPTQRTCGASGFSRQTGHSLCARLGSHSYYHCTPITAAAAQLVCVERSCGPHMRLQREGEGGDRDFGTSALRL